MTPVDHGVVWLTVGIQSNLVVPSSTGLLTHELAHTLRAQMGQARRKSVSHAKPGGDDVLTLPEGVCEWHAGRLKAELVVAVTKRVTLPVHRAKAEDDGE